MNNLKELFKAELNPIKDELKSIRAELHPIKENLNNHVTETDRKIDSLKADVHKT